MDASLPLSGTRVIDLTNLLPGPYATMILADFGADVIKVERPPAGDPGRASQPLLEGVSTRHRMINRNKRSIALNLKDPADKATMLGLVESTDVLVEGFRPGTMDRLGLSYAALAELNPRLVYCSINGFGSSGTDNPPAHDLNFMALAGLLALDPAAPPQLPASQFADLAAGSMRAVIGILLALIGRQSSGEGQLVDVAMGEGALLLQIEALAYLNAGQRAGTGETRLTGRYPCYQLYRTKDDRFMAVGATEPLFWRNLCAALDVPELVDQQYAEGQAARSVIEQVGERFMSRTAADWEARLQGIETCCTQVRTPAEAIECASRSERSPIFEQVTDSGGVIRQFISPVVLSKTPAKYRRPAPGLDDDRDEILLELDRR
ncbi:MAG: CaiB/BaiF CoA-transferase family protein [Acidimicrobiales bacterium]